MAFEFTVDKNVCINCGICMDLCPVHCLDMTRPTGDGELGNAHEVRSPVPGSSATHEWMMLAPVQVAACIGCEVCSHECPTNAITIAAGADGLTYARRGAISHAPDGAGWQPLSAYTLASPEEPGEVPWGPQHAWHVAERKETWQSWRTWLGEHKEDLRAPCQAACPVGTNAGLYVSLIGQGRYDEALAIAAEPNPFPSICGRVCTAPCEDVCRRGEFDAPIAIRDLKRFATDHGKVPPRHIRPLSPPRPERVAIVGAGPTGLSAAYYLARRGYPVTVIDAMPVAGGMMAIGIPEYRLPRAELARDISTMRELGITFQLNTAVGRDVALDDLQREYSAVLLAVGAQRSQRLDIAGERDFEQVMPATTFLKSYNLAQGVQLTGTVAVVGGGSTAMDAARSALRAGASKVTILYRRTQTEMPAQREEVRAALAEGIELHELAAPVRVLGEQGKVTTLRCLHMTLGETDETGRALVTPVFDSEFDLPVDHVLVAIGEAPDPSFLPPGTSVEVAAWGGLLVNPVTLATGAPGVFAAGDVTYGPRSIIHAAAHGRQAARTIHAYLQGLALSEVSEMPEDEPLTASLLPADGAIAVDLAPTLREVMPLRTQVVTRGQSDEYALGLSEEQARREANRCLRCDLAYMCPSVKLVDHPAVANVMTQ